MIRIRFNGYALSRLTTTPRWQLGGSIVQFRSARKPRAFGFALAFTNATRYIDIMKGCDAGNCYGKLEEIKRGATVKACADGF
jgi:hypothetical protein